MKCVVLLAIVIQCTVLLVQYTTTTNGTVVSVIDDTNSTTINRQYLRTCCTVGNTGKSFIIDESDNLSTSIIMCPPATPEDCPDASISNFSSCADILSHYPDSTSGYYDITLTNGSVMSVYCDMEGDNCDGEGGWTRIGYLNMTEPNTTCPPGLTPTIYNTEIVCYSIPLSTSIFYSSSDIMYNKVCGQARGYCHQSCSGFISSQFNDLDSVYVDGISITRGSPPRKHIWTYAGGNSTDGTSSVDCPCNNGSSTTAPSFIGNDYYCEAHTDEGWYWYDNLEDPLWDGADCESTESLCCTNPKLPWFMKTLDDKTSDDIEVRLCNTVLNNLATIDIFELYIK